MKRNVLLLLHLVDKDGSATSADEFKERLKILAIQTSKMIVSRDQLITQDQLKSIQDEKKNPVIAPPFICKNSGIVNDTTTIEDTGCKIISPF